MSVFNKISLVGASLTKAHQVRTGIREFLLPSYHPERHYMRGPGPACAHRASKEKQ
jgi:hypothetical protein